MKDKFLVVYLDDNNNESKTYSEDVQFNGNFVTFYTEDNEITISSERLLKIKRRIGGVRDNDQY